MPIRLLSPEEGRAAMERHEIAAKKAAEDEVEYKRQKRNENARLGRRATKLERWMLKRRMNLLPAPFQDLVAARPDFELPVPTLEEVSFANLIHQQRITIWQQRRTMMALKKEKNDRIENLAMELHAAKVRAGLLQHKLDLVEKREKSEELTRKMLDRSRARNALLWRLLRHAMVDRNTFDASSLVAATSNPMEQTTIPMELPQFPNANQVIDMHTLVFRPHSPILNQQWQPQISGDDLSALHVTSVELTPVELAPVELTPVELTPVELTPKPEPESRPTIDPLLMESTGKTISRKFPHCQTFSTTRLSHFKEHVIETCSKLPKTKDWQCEVCNTNYTYRNLQAHLNMYLQAPRNTTNGHQHLSVDDHKNLKRKYALMKATNDKAKYAAMEVSAKD